jgi:DNA-binding transcriptional LysR family regulator
MPQSSGISFELLRTFRTLIQEEGDAARAMRVLGINQPTISKRLQPLQHGGPLLKRPWLVREGKVWRLTDEGARVWPAVAELMRGYEALESFLEGHRTLRPSVRFACGQQMATGLVRTALIAFRKARPDVRLQISTLRGQARIEGVSSGLLDLALVTHDEPSIAEIARRPLHVAPLVTHHLALVCAAGSPWERQVGALPKAAAPARALASFPLVLPEPDAGVRLALDTVLHRQGVPNQLDIALEVGGWATILAFVRDGFGVGVLSEGALADTAGLVVRRLDPELFPPITARLICRRRAGTGDELDLSNDALEWWRLLQSRRR